MAQFYVPIVLLLLNIVSAVTAADDTPCGAKYQLLNITAEQKAYILKLHNTFREKVASGGQKGGEADDISFPSGNMNILSWDDESEYLAEHQVQQCKFKHDTNRVTYDQSETLGQILGTKIFDQATDLTNKYFDDRFEEWTSETQYVTNDFISSIKKYTPLANTSHLTQIIWGDTKYVGCALMQSQRIKDKFVYDITCNYRPAGNILQATIYKNVTANCTKNEDFKSLCGKIRPSSEDDYHERMAHIRAMATADYGQNDEDNEMEPPAPIQMKSRGEIYLCNHSLLIMLLHVVIISTIIWF